MSRSFRRIPIIPRLNADSDSPFKRQVNRRTRRVVRHRVKRTVNNPDSWDGISIPLSREFGSVDRSTPKDGKKYKPIPVMGNLDNQAKRGIYSMMAK